MSFVSTITDLLRMAAAQSQENQNRVATEAEMTIDPELLLSDEIPADAFAMIREMEALVQEVRSETTQRVSALREACEEECTLLRKRCEVEVNRVEAESADRLTPVLKTLFAELKAMQQRYVKEGLLDEALAIRAQIKSLRSDLFGIQNDPGSMSDYSTSDAGRSFLFELTGTTDGVIWGNDVYTADSRLATAAVHCGLLRVNERGIIRVTLTDSGENTFESTERHGVQSLEYLGFSLGYRMSKV